MFTLAGGIFIVESILIKDTLSDEEVNQLILYKSELAKIFDSINDIEKELLKAYYETNLNFIESVIKGNAIKDFSICLQSIEASIDYLKMFVKDKD